MYVNVTTVWGSFVSERHKTFSSALKTTQALIILINPATTSVKLLRAPKVVISCAHVLVLPAQLIGQVDNEFGRSQNRFIS